MLQTTWEPFVEIPRADLVKVSEEILAAPDHEFTSREDVFRIRALELDWDIGCRVYEPKDVSRVVVGADGKKAGLFLLHGGQSDHRYFEPIASLLAAKFGYKVVCMTYPGRLYLLDESRDWPGDTINPDGTARTPLWCRDSPITPDQYELIEDRTDPKKRQKWGTLFFLRAKEGTEFHDRMAAWPVAFEEGMKGVCARHFPEADYSVYVHGHSTGGSFVHYLTQRVANVAGIIGTESSAFGSIAGRLMNQTWDFPFSYLTLRTWRHIAKYLGPEAGLEGARRLPWLMEEVLEAWEKNKKYPQFKCEYFIQFAALEPLNQAARTAAKRLGMNAEETEALVQRYLDYTRPLSGPGVKPVPPILMGIAEGSVDHTLERYRNTVLPMFAAMDPPPKVRLVYYRAGVHAYQKPEEGLPRGISPMVGKVWDEAIRGGYYLSN